ncbi:MAG TPA: UbiA prenyltransferase family protein, partial [Tepidiformaceae bacterium]|nr:UbiA prenyltransferase family protein [Tepidiformaceae bacterium]
FAAFVFSAGTAWELGDVDTWWPLLWRNIGLFVVWCLVSSAVYLVNDIRDREVDRLHPRKRNRAIARGALSPATARAAALGLFIVAIPGAIALDATGGLILAGYAAVMLGYSWGLKEVAILDIIILCGGVVARAVAGAATIDVDISPWLYVCTSFAAFFFASSKRWAEYRQLGPDAIAHRPALAQYTGDLLNQLLIISASTALLAYALYTIESENVPADGSMALTLPFVAFATFRYLLLLDGPRRGEAPDRILFTDFQILGAVLGFGATAVAVLLTH